MRTVLVIGAGGLVGTYVAAALRDQRLITTYHRNVPPGARRLDITDASAVRATIDEVTPDVIVLAAAEPWVERCEREPAATRRINVDAPRTVVETVRATGALLVVFSSEYVFDGSKDRYTEDDPTSPLNEYGRQKVDLETAARTLDRHLVCRTSGVFGWEASRKNFVCQLLHSARAGREFVVPSDQLITPTYAPDLAATLVRLIDLGTTGTIHLVGPRSLPRAEFANVVCDAFALPTDLIVPRPTDELGLAARRPLRAGLADGRLRSLVGPMSAPEAALRDMREREVTQRPS